MKAKNKYESIFTIFPNGEKQVKKDLPKVLAALRVQVKVSGKELPIYYYEFDNERNLYEQIAEQRLLIDYLNKNLKTDNQSIYVYTNYIPFGRSDKETITSSKLNELLGGMKSIPKDTSGVFLIPVAHHHRVVYNYDLTNVAEKATDIVTQDFISKIEGLNNKPRKYIVDAITGRVLGKNPVEVDEESEIDLEAHLNIEYNVFKDPTPFFVFPDKGAKERFGRIITKDQEHYSYIEKTRSPYDGSLKLELS